MKLINPENSYKNNIAGKVGPVINESYLSEEVCKWLIELLSSVYVNSLDDAMSVANLIKIYGSKESIPEDYTLFRLLCTIKGYIHSPNFQINKNKRIEEEIFNYIIDNYKSDFHAFMQSFINERDERQQAGGFALYVETQKIAIFLLQKRLIEYEKFIQLASLPKAFYKLCKHRNLWTPDDFTIEENIFEEISNWGFWLSVLNSALPEEQFKQLYEVVDSTFLNMYLKNETGKSQFTYAEVYISNVLNVAGYQNDRHLMVPQFSWLFKEQIKYFNILFDHFNRIQFDNKNLKSLLRVAHIAYRYSIKEMTDAVRKELILLSQRSIGNFRSQLKKVDYSNREYLSDLETVNEAINFIAYFESPSKAYILLIQLLRNYGKVSINDDLTFSIPKSSDLTFAMPLNRQQFPDQEPIQNPGWFVSKIEWLISTFFELGESDSDEARNDLAKFFGTRLKTPKKMESPTNLDFTEPDPIWRAAYVSCIRALHCNPGGKLHQTLNFSRNFDPDEDVMIEARKAYKEIRHNNPLPSEMERVLTIRRVFWYLRQAHFVSLLGIKHLDTRGAQRTYSKEVDICKARMKK